MKTCQNCGIEIGTRDGDNVCVTCEKAKVKQKRKLRQKNNRRERESVMRSLGLVKVKGAMGGTYWE